MKQRVIHAVAGTVYMVVLAALVGLPLYAALLLSRSGDIIGQVCAVLLAGLTLGILAWHMEDLGRRLMAR